MTSQTETVASYQVAEEEQKKEETTSVEAWEATAAESEVAAERRKV